MDNLALLKCEKHAVILAHYYQDSRVQAVADFVGDSLALAQQASKLHAPIIVMCGVKFMAETVKLLCPDSKVLLPAPDAGCMLADSCTYEALLQVKAQHPDALVVSYINTTAAVKTLTDITVTSSNAVKIVQSLPQDKPILFGPDKNLGGYIQRLTGRKNMFLWDGCCPIHDSVDIHEVLAMKKRYPQAPLLVHPECNSQVVAQADVVSSTKGLIEYVRDNAFETYLVATEPGVIYQMQQFRPKAQFIPLTDECINMRKITLEKVYATLKEESNEVVLDKEVSLKAIVPIRRMLGEKFV